MPIALSWGSADSSFRSPMAVAVIGGLITSAFLSLLVIPAVFTYVDDLEQGIKRVLAWLRRHKTSAPDAAPDLRMETDARSI